MDASNPVHNPSRGAIIIIEAQFPALSAGIRDPGSAPPRARNETSIIKRNIIPKKAKYPLSLLCEGGRDIGTLTLFTMILFELTEDVAADGNEAPSELDFISNDACKLKSLSKSSSGSCILRAE
jgi:hypothetical protein